MPFTFTNIEYSDMMFIYGFCNGSSWAAAQEYRQKYPDRRHPDSRVFSRVFQHLRDFGTFPGVLATAERAEGAQEGRGVVQAALRSPSISTRRLSSRLGVTRMSAWRTLRREGFHPYHLHKTQHLKPEDHEKRLNFCHWLLQHQHHSNHILYTDEATFTRHGVTNTHNDHWWAKENPHQTVESNFQHRFSVNVWCGIVDDLLLGPFIFEGRLTGDVYHDFLRDELPLLLTEVPLHIYEHLILQQDGAPPHSSKRVKEYLNQLFPERWIGRGGPQQWPARSPDLTPLDFYLWGHMKSLVYKNKPHSREQLIQRIQEVTQEIKNNRPMLRRVTTSVLDRARKCIECEGSHFEHLL